MSAEPESKPIQRGSDTTKVASVVSSATGRHSRSPSSNSATTPTSGKKMTTVNSIEEVDVQGYLQDQIHRQDQYGAERHTQRIVLRLAALEEPHEPGPPGKGPRHAIHGAVDHGDVNGGPQPLRQAKRRPHDRPIVRLIDIPFVERKPIRLL